MAALGLGVVGAAATVAMLFKETVGLRHLRREEEAQREALRRPDLAGQPLAEVVGSLMERIGQATSPAASFDWSAPGLFVDAMGNDMSLDVAHMLARAIESANSMPPAAGGISVLGNLAHLAESLATFPDMRARLANTVSEANEQCQDRLGVSLGQLILANWMHAIRAPEAPPAGVVLCSLMHAATRAATGFVHDLVGREAETGEVVEPSAELMLYTYHAIEAGLRELDVNLPYVFPPNDYVDGDDVLHYDVVRQWAEDLTSGLVEPLLGRLELNARSVVDLLMRHGGTEVEEIFSSRLAPLLERGMADLRRRDEELQAAKDQMPSDVYVGECAQLMQESQAIRRTIYEKAVRSATLNTDGVWNAPAPA